jgi:hypothetical protein
MLTAFFHRKRKAAEALKKANGAADSASQALEQTRRVYGVRLLVRGVLWASIYLLSRGLLALQIESSTERVIVALLPTPFFVWYVWTWMNGIGEMDELERRIELEALGFAFPAALILLMTIGLLDIADTLTPEDFSLHHIWMVLPLLYFIGLWVAKRRYS